MIEGETNGYVLSLKIGYTVIDDTINGFLKPINKQVEMVCQQIAEDPQLQVRFNRDSRMSGKDLKICTFSFSSAHTSLRSYLLHRYLLCQNIGIFCKMLQNFEFTHKRINDEHLY